MPKNENPLHSITQLDKEINYKDFVYKNYFKTIKSFQTVILE